MRLARSGHPGGFEHPGLLCPKLLPIAVKVACGALKRSPCGRLAMIFVRRGEAQFYLRGKSHGCNVEFKTGEQPVK